MTPGEVTADRDGSGDPALDEARLTPSAPVAAPEAAAAIRACYGLAGELTRLPGEADDNFLLGASGGQRYVVKVAHLRADPAVVGVQVRVLRHIASVAAGLPVPRVLPAIDGQPWTVVADGPLRGRVVHVLTYLDGELLRSVRTDAALRRTLGVTLARLGSALREFDDPLVHRPLLWDLAQLPQLQPLLPQSRGLLGEQLSRLAIDLPQRLATQRTQLVHNDFSPDNTLISADASRVCGIIDFGDVTVTALVNDVAIAAAYELSDERVGVEPLPMVDLGGDGHRARQREVNGHAAEQGNRRALRLAATIRVVEHSGPLSDDFGDGGEEVARRDRQQDEAGGHRVEVRQHACDRFWATRPPGEKTGRGAGGALSGWSPPNAGEYTDDQDPVKAIAAGRRGVKLVTIAVCQRRRAPVHPPGSPRMVDWSATVLPACRSSAVSIPSHLSRPVRSRSGPGPGPTVQMKVSGPTESGPVPDCRDLIRDNLSRPIRKLS